MAFVTLNEYISAERSSKFKGAEIKKQQTLLVRLLAYSKKFKLPEQLYDVHIIWEKPNNMQDHDNIAFAKKFIFDGLIDAGALKGDGAKHINNLSDSFELNKKARYVSCYVIFDSAE